MTGRYTTRTAAKAQEGLMSEFGTRYGEDAKNNLIELQRWSRDEPEPLRLGVAGIVFTATGFLLGGLIGNLERRFGLVITPRSALLLQTAVPALLGGGLGALIAWVRAQRRLTTAFVTSEEFRRRLVTIERNHALWVSLSAVLHDVRNPLHNITLLLERLDQPGTDTARVRAQALEQLDRINQRVRRVMDQVSEFSGEITLRPICITEVVQSVTEMISPLARQSGIEFQSDSAGSDPLVIADRDLLAQAIDHLALNSLQILSELPQSAGRRLAIRVEGDAEYVHLLIEDNGPGLPSAIQERLFEPLAGARSRGMGLGLAIAHALAHAAGGTLELGRTGADGTQFRLRLRKQ